MATAFLLDTHTLIWTVYSPRHLGREARAVLEASGNDIYVSAASAFEIANKHRLGKLDEARSLALDFARVLAGHGFAMLPLDAEHGRLAGNLAIPHRDPFDRMLIAQAQLEQLILISNEERFDQFGVLRLW